jgi:hypothetical protein
MARAGYKIFDADTHLYEPVEQIEAYLSTADRAKLDALAAAVTQGIKDTATPWDVRWQGPPFPSDRASFDPHARIKDTVRHTIEALGEDTLMFATDYPQSESWFPKSVDRFLAWQSISAATKRKLLWDNPLRCHHRDAAKHVGA